MKIALKYGSIITACFIIWVLIAHWLFPDPHSAVHSAGAAAFANLIEVICIVLAIRERKSLAGGVLRFREALKTGVAVAVVYGITASIFFAVALIVMGNKMLAVEPGAGVKPLWQVALGAFLGLGVGAVFFGLVYSAIASFVLATRQSQ